MNDLHYKGLTPDTIKAAFSYAAFLSETTHREAGETSFDFNRRCAKLACQRVGIHDDFEKPIELLMDGYWNDTIEWARADDTGVEEWLATEPPTGLVQTHELAHHDGVPLAALFKADDNRHYFFMMLGDPEEFDNVQHGKIRPEAFTGVLCRINPDIHFMTGSKVDRKQEITGADMKRLMTMDNEAWLFDWYGWGLNPSAPNFQRTWVKADWLPQVQD